MVYHRPVLCRVLSGLGTILLVSGSNAFAADFTSSVNPKEGWKLATDAKDVIIYSRPHAESNLKEFKAIGFIDAPSYAVHAVIDDFECGHAPMMEVPDEFNRILNAFLSKLKIPAATII